MRIYVLGAILLGLVANIAVALAAPPGKTLSIKAKPSPVVFGRTATLSGKLTGTGHAGKTIQLQADAYPFDSKFKNVATTTTNNAGSWTATDKPLVNTHYRAKQGPTESSIITELVRIRVSLRLSDSTPKAGSRVRFSGRACPQHDGALVKIQRRTRTHHWRTVRRTTLKDIPLGHCSKYRRTFRVFHDGTFRTFVVSGDKDHANGISRRRHVDVHS